MPNPEKALTLAARSVSIVLAVAVFGAFGWWYVHRPDRSGSESNQSWDFSRRLESMQNRPGVELRKTEIPTVEMKFYSEDQSTRSRGRR